MCWKGSTTTATGTGRRDREYVKVGAKQRLPCCGCKQRAHVPVLALMLCFLALTGVDALDSAEELKVRPYLYRTVSTSSSLVALVALVCRTPPFSYSRISKRSRK